MAQYFQRHSRTNKHNGNDRLVRNIHITRTRHAVVGHDMGIHNILRPMELLIHTTVYQHTLGTAD